MDVTAPHTAIRQILEPDAWRARRRAHVARLAPVVEPYSAVRKTGRKQPVLDFLFEYYAFRRTKLMRWSPGLGVALLDAGDDRELDMLPGLVDVQLDGRAARVIAAAAFPEKRRDAARFVLDLLRRTASRPPFLGCSGMHEWAMVYRSDGVRHEQLPLRMDDDALAAFVESQPIVCSHYDAFRFFTRPARPLNRIQPAAERMAELEQPGCLHVNMDIYRWATKLYPWVGSELIAEAFLLAARIRTVDMQASPYDLSAHGLEPIAIETAAGRRRYAELQRGFAEEAAPLRAQLIEAVERLVDGLEAVTACGCTR